MANHSPSIPFLRKHRYTLSGQTFIAVFVVLLILILWLHLILALQIEFTGRQIQTGVEELEKIQREINARKREIAIARSQQSLNTRAWNLGYRPQTPIYLSVPRSSTQSPIGTEGEQEHLSTIAADSEAAAFQPLPAWVSLSPRLDVSTEMETAP